MHLLSETAQAVLVIDVQVGTIDPNDPIDRGVLDNIVGLLGRARAKGVPVVYVQHHSLNPQDTLVPSHRHWPIHPEVTPRPGEVVIHKHSSDSFLRTDLDQHLRSLGVQHIAVVGCATDYCVDTTVRSALSHGYDVTLASDGHTTGPDEEIAVDVIIAHHNRTLSRLAIEDRRIRVVPAAEIPL